MSEGSQVWLIPDGFIPETGSGTRESHEAICVLDTSDRDANLSVSVLVPAGRTRHVRADLPEPFGGAEIPRGVPQAVRVESDVPVTVQHSRTGTTQEALSLMTTPAHPVLG